MLMVVLGAGASHDSVPRDDWRASSAFQAEYQPPLAVQLFDAVRRPQAMGQIARNLEQVPGGGLGGMVARLAALVKGNADGLEAELGRLQERAERDEVTARQLIAVRFYIRDVVASSVGNWISFASHQTNYAALVNAIDELRRDAAEDDDPVVWVNFNYDKMLDHAANQVLGWTLDRVDQYLANPNHTFFKPHGSTDWVRTVTFKGTPAAGHQYEAIFRASEIEELSDVIDVGAAQPGQVTIPALAVPIAEKGTFECPQVHYENLEAILTGVDRLITIGWRGREGHFLKMLREGISERAAITVVGKDISDAENIGQHLYANLGPVEIIPSTASGFSAFLALPGALQAAWQGRSPSPAEAG